MKKDIYEKNIRGEKKAQTTARSSRLHARRRYACNLEVVTACTVSDSDNQIVKDLETRQIGLKVLTQNIDTSTPEGRLFFHMNAAFDQFQREIIFENTRAGLKSARKNGRIGGRPTLMTDDKVRTAQSMLKDTENYPFISDIIKTLDIGRTTFHRHFPPEKIEQLRPQ